MPQQTGLIDPKLYTNQLTTLCYNSNLEGRREGTPEGRTPLRNKNILLYWEAVLKARSVVETAARQ